MAIVPRTSLLILVVLTALVAGCSTSRPTHAASSGEPGVAPSPSDQPSAAPDTGPAPEPTPANTGWKHTGVTLRTVDERVYADTPGQIFDGLDLRDGIVIRADNVTVKRSRVQCGDCPGIWVDWDVRNTLIEDVEITSASKKDRIDRAITAGRTNDLTVRRAYVHDTQRGIEFGYSAVIEDSWVDEAYNPTGAHSSAVGGEASADFKLTLRNNWIAQKPEQNNSAATLLYPGGEGPGPQRIEVLIERNVFNGGTYGLWLSSDSRWRGKVTVRDNIFDTKYFASCGYYDSHFIDKLDKISTVTVDWRDNVWRAPGTAKHGTEVPFILP